MRPIFKWMDMWINKTILIGEIKNHKNFKKQLNIPKKSLFDVDFGGEESLAYTSLKTMRNAVTVNSERYRSMMENFFWPELAEMDLRNMRFQQDGATCHTLHQTINLLKKKLGNRIISRNGPINWPARTCDLTPCDFFWGVFWRTGFMRMLPRLLKH